MALFESLSLRDGRMAPLLPMGRPLRRHLSETARPGHVDISKGTSLGIPSVLPAEDGRGKLRPQRDAVQDWITAWDPNYLEYMTNNP